MMYQKLILAKNLKVIGIHMRLFDSRFKDNKKAYIGQCAFAAVYIFGILLLLNIAYDTVVAASIGASTFIAFTMPQAKSSAPRYLVGGYCVGAVCGSAMNYLSMYVINSDLAVSPHLINIIAGALSVGLAMFLMTLLNLEHPPAVALALGLTREENVLLAAFAAMISIVLMSLIKRLFIKKFINLI